MTGREHSTARTISLRRLIAGWIGFACLVALCCAESCRADVTLPAVFSDNLLLQREQANPVWGWAEPGETVVVTIADRTILAKADADGRWRATLPKLTGRSEPLVMSVRGSSGSEIIVRNVLVGEVWLCTGPSNIYWPVKRCDHAEEEIAAATYPGIRFFTVKRHAANEPQEDCRGSWLVCSPETVGDASGVGYFFSRRIHRDLNVPVGMIQSFWGGSRIEAWTSREALENTTAVRPILDWWENRLKEYNPEQAEAEYRRRLKRWEQAASEAERAGKSVPGKPRKPEDPRFSHHRPACLYNGMIAPLIPYGVRGVISYQGLGNLFWADYNRVLLSVQIHDWRSRWKQPSMPFGMVQPAPYPCDRWPKQIEDAYSVQREAQLLVLNEVPDTGVAPTMDIGDLEQLHFTNKQDVGRRLASWALATVYERSVPFAGPLYESMTVEGDRIRIHFKHTGEGLSTSDGRPPNHFTIAGDDGLFLPADATIDGHTVIVHSRQVPAPIAVRFAWSDTAIPNLVNSHNLPASLFRTDVSPMKILPDRENSAR